MKSIKKPLCIIPAKGTSKRFKRKNIAILAGKKLLSYSIESALDSGIFEKVCVSSEDKEILDTAKEYNGVLALKRPDELSTEFVEVRHVCKYILESFSKEGNKYESFCILLPTSPLRNKKDIIDSYKIFKEKDAECLMSVVAFSHPPQRAVYVKDGYVQPYFGVENMKPAQKLEKLYRHDGSILFCKSESFFKTDGFYENKILPYFIPEERAVDIDGPLDLKWAEFLLSEYKKDS